MGKHHHVSLLAVALIVLSSLFFAVEGSAVKLAGDLPIYQKLLFRNLVILMIISLRLIGKGRAAFFGTRGNRRYLILRGVLGLIGTVCFFFSLTRMHLTDVTMLATLSPFFVILLAALFLKEKLKRIQIPALILAFTGALFIIKPRFDMSILPALVICLSTVLVAGCYIIIRFLGDRENPDTILFTFSLISTLASLVPAVIFWEPPTLLQWIALLGAGAAATGGQFCLTHGYQLAPAGEVSIYSYTRILFAGIIGVFLFQEVPDRLSLLGGALIVLVAVGLFILSHRQYRRRLSEGVSI